MSGTLLASFDSCAHGVASGLPLGPRAHRPFVQQCLNIEARQMQKQMRKCRTRLEKSMRKLSQRYRYAMMDGSSLPAFLLLLLLAYSYCSCCYIRDSGPGSHRGPMRSLTLLQSLTHREASARTLRRLDLTFFYGMWTAELQGNPASQMSPTAVP